MNRIILLLCTFLAVVKANNDSVSAGTIPSNIVVRTDDFINMSQQQYLKSLQNYDKRLDCLRKNFLENAEKINDQIERLAETIANVTEVLNMYKDKNDFNKRCVSKYGASIPTKNHIKTAIRACILEASSQFTSLLSSPLSTRISLHTYYTNNFQTDVENCGKRHGRTTENYNLCITAATSNINSFVISNENIFNSQMKAAECAAKTNIKTVGDCSYIVQIRTLSSMAEVKLLVHNCIEGKDECKPCAKGFICPYIYNLEVDYELETIPNIFFNRPNHTDCLMLSVNNS